MTTELFNQLIERRIELIRKVLIAKNAEYNSGADKLSNFKRSAELANEALLVSGDDLFDVRDQITTPAHEAAGFMRKHVISVFDLINQVANGESVPRDMIDEKIGDMINYAILIEALLNEQTRRTL